MCFGVILVQLCVVGGTECCHLHHLSLYDIEVLWGASI